MANHLNFYENINEARMRIGGTVVLYDGKPYSVLAICDHKPDGVFRVYLLPTGLDIPIHVPPLDSIPRDHPSLGPALDTWLDANKNTPVIRKQMDSPRFNKFRPFPLGMCNTGGHAFYVERQPTRKTEQGLTRASVVETYLNGGKAEVRNGLTNIGLTGAAFRDTILGDYPSASECLAALTSNSTANSGAAFHREFALIAGPLELIFLAYRGDYIGVLPDESLNRLRLGKRFGYLREACQDLGIFNQII